MTLDEAIEHAKEVARTCDDSQCAADHMQLAEWLRQARSAEKAARYYTAKIRGLKDENAKLRELCKDLWKDALQFDGFWDYVYDDGTNYRDDELPHYQERMRELGIEVDG